MNIFFLIYMAVIIYITVPICKIVWHDKLDNDLTFLLCTNYIVIFILTLLLGNKSYLVYNILLGLTLVILSFLLIRKIKKVFGHYQLLSLPYFGFVVFVFSNILVLI